MQADRPAPELEEVEARMAPGRFSERGFLGEAERLEQVLEEDAQQLGALGLTARELALPLDRLLTKAKAARLRRARIGLVFARVVLFRGFQLCPWSPNPPEQCTFGEGVTHASLDWRAQNVRNGTRLSGPGLAVHLIRDHGFFGGMQAEDRVDPVLLARLFELDR